MKSRIRESVLPTTEAGNDPNDNRDDQNYLDTEREPNEISDIATVMLQNPTEDSIALLFADEFKGKVLYCHQRGCWLRWTDQYWEPEQTLLVPEYIRRLSRNSNASSHSRLGKASFIRGVETLAKGDRALAVHGNELDRERYLLNTPAGTYDLKTGIRRDHNPSDRITKITSVAPSEAGGEVFLQFLSDITLGDRSLQSFLQRALGSMLSGAYEEHWLMFWIGDGRNGKNTLGDVVKDVFGNYAKKILATTLLSRKNESHPTEIANLQGIRLAVSSEIPDGSFMNEARIKELTGDSTISARFMRQDFFEFERSHKHLIYGNHRPQLRSIDAAMRSRLKIVPFKADFTGREDPDMPQKLNNEAGFILKWLMDGHQMWLDAGKKIGSCQAVDAENEDYFSSQSTPDMWLDECCTSTVDEGQPGRYWDKAATLYQSYKDWKTDRGEIPLSQTRWGAFMATKFEKKKADGARYAGVKLI